MCNINLSNLNTAMLRASQIIHSQAISETVGEVWARPTSMNLEVSTKNWNLIVRSVSWSELMKGPALESRRTDPDSTK
jgi:hypothetical protein